MIKNIDGIFRQFKYVLDVFTILIGDEVIDVDTMFVDTITIEKDFDKDMFPVLQLSFSMDDDLYYKIIENKENVQFKVRLMKYMYDENHTIRSKKQFINDVFISFIEEQSNRIDKKYTRHNEKNEMAVRSKSLRLFLFKKQDLMSSKDYTNGIFHQVSLTTLVSYILSKSGLRKVLMTPFHNISVFDEIRIPPMTLIDTLDYLENVYGGFYDNGSTKFFDYDCMYFIDKGKKNKVYRNNEFVETILVIQDITSTTSTATGCFLDNINMKTYINVSPKAFNFISGSIMNEHIHGNKAIIISPNTGNVTKIEPPVKELTGNVYKLLIDRYENKRCISEYSNKVMENDNLLQLSVTGIDISSFTPNKSIKLIFEEMSLNKNLGGDYRISRIGFVFKKEGNEYTVLGDIELKKIK